MRPHYLGFSLEWLHRSGEVVKSMLSKSETWLDLLRQHLQEIYGSGSEQNAIPPSANEASKQLPRNRNISTGANCGSGGGRTLVPRNV
jgi:hypothetical protein